MCVIRLVPIILAEISAHHLQFFSVPSLHRVLPYSLIIGMFLVTNVITMLMIPIQQALSPFQLPCSKYTNEHV